MSDNRLRHERLFDSILDELTEPEDKHTRCIVQALSILALELYELNVAASEVMGADRTLSSIQSILEDWPKDD